MTLLVGSLFVDDVDAALAVARRATGADLVEFRIDGARSLDLAPLVLGRPLPAIVTARSRAEGGRFEGSEAERIGLLARALDLGVEFVDVEWAAWPQARALLDPARTIVSRHDFDRVPPWDEVQRFFRDARDSGAALGKLAATPRSVRELALFLDAFRGARAPGIALGMGDLGLASRVLAARAGSAWVYGSLDSAGTAPGQPSVRELRRPYRVPALGAATQLFGILGRPLGHSASPWLHNLALERHGLDAVYLPFDTADLDDLFASADALGLRGASVTIPHKEAVASRCGSLSPDARALRAVNTIVRRPEGWHGENFDVGGFLDALAGGPDLRGASAVVLGAGGAGRAVAFALRGAGARVVVGSRTLERAEALARDLGVDARAWESLPLESADLVVNATPVGMWPSVGDRPIDVSRLRDGAWVVETIYNPLETRLLREARERGLRTTAGVDMFVGQAARQFRLFTGIEPDREWMRATCVERLAPRSIVLVGLRGSGKTTVGRIVARRRGVRFVDLDEEIAAEAGATIAEIFAREGEPAFREREHRALGRALERDGRVVAAGGGVVLDERNRRLLVERATCIHLDAPNGALLERLAAGFATDAQRPPLTALPLAREIETLAREREPHYRAVARAVVPAGQGTPEAVAVRVLEALLDLEA
jgi:shikimate dehydrogenase/3-dehydroquinate dehydratase type I